MITLCLASASLRADPVLAVIIWLIFADLVMAAMYSKRHSRAACIGILRARAGTVIVHSLSLRGR